MPTSTDTTPPPAPTPTPAPFRLQRLLRIAPPQVFAVLLMTAMVSIVILIVSEATASRIERSRSAVASVETALDRLALVRTGIANAESNQRGYLLTGSGAYLPPFEAASSLTQNAIGDLASLTGDDLEWRGRVAALREHVTARLDQLKFGVMTLQRDGPGAALDYVRGGQGSDLMGQITRTADGLEPALRAELGRREALLDRVWLQQRIGVGVVVLLNLIFLGVLANLMVRQFRQREERRAEMQRDNEMLERAVADRTEELSALSIYLQSSSEHEKARLARDLHDELGGILTSAKIDIAWLEGRSIAADPEVVPRLGRLSAVLDEAVDLKRRVVENLRPSLLDHLGLGPALEWYIGEHCAKAGLKAELNLPEAGEALPSEVAIAIYRTVQEGLTNTIKYARAKTVEVNLERVQDPSGHERYHLVQHDDGIGIKDFRPDHLSHGMAGMRQRARALGGSLEVRSAPGRGTTIEASYPLTPAE